METEDRGEPKVHKDPALREMRVVVTLAGSPFFGRGGVIKRFRGKQFVDVAIDNRRVETMRRSAIKIVEYRMQPCTNFFVLTTRRIVESTLGHEHSAVMAQLGIEFGDVLLTGCLHSGRIYFRNYDGVDRGEIDDREALMICNEVCAHFGFPEKPIPVLLPRERPLF